MEVNPIWILLTRLADTSVIMFFSGVVVLFFLFKGHLRVIGRFLLVLLGTQLVVQLLKISTKVPRPDIGLVEAVGYAFPSGHAATAVAFYGFLGLWLSRKMDNWWFFYILAGLSFLIGVSRIALGVHTLFQVAVGWLIGWLFVWGVEEYRKAKFDKKV